jgi:outer membrane protein assembly factor BamB
MARQLSRQHGFFRLAIVGGCWLLACGGLAARAQEWTRFRGPNGSGESETKIPAQWTERDINWKVELPGAGHSSPVVWGHTIFLTGAAPDASVFMVLALNADDGHLLWKKEYPASSYHIHTQNSFATGTPAVDAQRVYVAWATPQAYTLVALTHTGEEVWRHSLGPFTSQHGFGSSPIVCGDLVVIDDEQDGANPNEMSSSKKKGAKTDVPTADGDDDGKSFLLAVAAATGQERWKAPRKSTVVTYATPCLREPKSGQPELICDSRSHGFSGIDLATGHVNWEFPIFDRRAVGSPILVDGLVLGSCGVGSGNNTLYAVRPGDSHGRKPQVVYKIDKTSAPYVPTPVAKGNLVFMWSDRGFATCVNGLTGKTIWRERVGGDFSGSPVRAGDKLFCVSVDGDVIVLAASEKFALLGRNPLNETCRSTPAIAGGHLFVRTESHLLSIGGQPKL